MGRALINVPKTARRGDIIAIKALVAHPMETGFRYDMSAKLVARDIIHTFVCIYNGEEVMRVELFPAITANPFLSFTTVATESGTLAFRWTDDRGVTQTETASITVT